MEEKAEQAKQQKQQNNLLLLACTRGYTADAQHLVQTGAQVSARDKKGCTTLHFAAAHGQLDIVTYLWSKGAELDWESPDGRTALHVAALKGHGIVVDFLLSKHTWADAQDAQDDTPLHLAARGKSGQALSHLLSARAATGLQNKLGLTPLAEAVVQGRTPNAELLIAQDPKGLQHRPQGWSLLHLAASLGLADSVQLLLKHKADVHDDTNSSGLTPLHAAAIAGSVACVKLLLDAGASTSVLSRDGSLAKDLVPRVHTDSSQLQALLKSTAMAPQQGAVAPPTSSGKAGTGGNGASSDTSQVIAFRALTPKQQLGRCQRWAEADLSSPNVSSELRAFWPEVRKRLLEAHTTSQALSLHKMLMKLHDDDDYQKDVGDPKALDAIILLLQKHPDRFERYTQNPAIKRAFKKIEQFQSVVKMTGNKGKVPWQETLVQSRGPNWKAEDDQRKKGLELMLQAQLEATVAAALAGSDEDAAKAADTAAADAKQRLTASQRQGAAAAATSAMAPPGSKPAGTTASSSATAASSNSPGSSGLATAARSSGKPPRPRQAADTGEGGPSTSGGGNARQRTRSSQQGQSGRAGPSGQDSSAEIQPAAGRGNADDDDPDEYKPLTWRLMPRQAGASPWHGTLQEALWQMRWQIAGNLVLVILFFIYTSWLRYTGGSRPPQSESPNPGDVDLGRGSKL